MALENATNMTNSTLGSVRGTADSLHLAFKDLLEGSSQSWIASIPQNNIVFFGIMVVLAFALSYGFVWICKTIIKTITSRTETDLDDILLQKLQHPAAISLFLLLLSVALAPLSIDSKIADILNTILISFNLLLLGTIANRIIGTLVVHFGQKIAAKTDSTVDDQLLPIVKRMITVVIYIITILFIIANWGINIGPLLAGAGIAGIALAFAMQESLKNIFGGISLVFDRAYGLGERVKLSDGTVGTVVDISLRSTKIRTPTGDLITVPNGKIANENFQNYAQPTHETRVLIPFSVAYGTDLDTTKKVVLAAMKDIPHKIEKQDEDKTTKVEFLEMGPFSLNFRASFWVSDYTESWDAKLLANERIYTALVKNKIEIPFPTTTVNIRK